MQSTPPTGQGGDLKNLIIALVLASVVMVGWQHFYEQPRIEAQKAADQVTEEQLQQAQQARLSNQIQAGSNEIVPTNNSADANTNSAAVPRVTIESDTLKGSIALKGGKLDDIILTQYQQTLSPGSDYVHLLKPAVPFEPSYSAAFGVITGDSSIKLPDENTLWQANTDRLTPQQPLVLTYRNGQGLVFEKTISLDKHYLFTVSLKVTNALNRAVTLFPYSLVNRTSPPEGEAFALLHEGPIGAVNNELKQISYDELRDDGKVAFDESKGWLGITDKYWLTAIIPPQSESVDMTFRQFTRAGQDAFQVDARGNGVQIAAGSAHEFTTRFYAGAKEVKLLDQYGELLGIPLFDRAVDFGFLYFLTKPIFLILSFFGKLTGNFGVAILLLTVGIRLLMFPLANKSFTAMSQMKMLGPKMKEIREKFSDDPMKMNMEIMNMYKREKVNPVSGCLPILLQLPVFFALYKVLFVTIEMRHAPFFGWVQDLSAPDPTSIINLFGLLPFDVAGFPAWLNIGIWPLIMCGTMVLQQKLNPKPADEMQAMIIGWMPYVFLFMFASFPAGLVVYWAWNNMLSVAQQWVIQRRLQSKTEAKHA